MQFDTNFSSKINVYFLKNTFDEETGIKAGLFNVNAFLELGSGDFKRSKRQAIYE